MRSVAARTPRGSITCVEWPSPPSCWFCVSRCCGAVTSGIDPRASLGVVQQWIYNYRAKPDYAHVPAAVRVLFHSQTFKEPENAGIYLGFIAGAIGSNPAKAEQLVNSFFPVPPEDEWVIIRAIAYSGLAGLAQSVAPGRAENAGAAGDDRRLSRGHAADADRHPAGGQEPGMMDKLNGVFTHNSKDDKKLNMAMTYAGNQDLLDTLWGYYFATGSHLPILRIMQMLPWSKSRDTVEKLTVGSMARYTLASYAVRDANLREFLRSELAEPAGGDQGAARRSGRGRRHRAARRRAQGCARGRRGTQDQGLGLRGAISTSGARSASARLRSAASRRRRWGRSRSAFPA